MSNHLKEEVTSLLNVENSLFNQPTTGLSTMCRKTECGAVQFGLNN